MPGFLTESPDNLRKRTTQLEAAAESAELAKLVVAQMSFADFVKSSFPTTTKLSKQLVTG